MKNKILLLLIGLIFSTGAMAAQEKFSFREFANLPVLHEGRIKPLDSFARITMREIAGREDLPGINHRTFLAETLFDPASAMDRPVFLLRDAEVKTRMGLDPARNYFSFSELQPGLAQSAQQTGTLLEADPKTLTGPQSALIKLHDQALGFAQLLRSFSMILPLDVEIPASFKTKQDGPSDYLSMVQNEDRLRRSVQQIIKRKGADPKTYTEREKALALLAFQIEQIRAGGEGNDAFKVIPADWQGAEFTLISPWQTVLDGQGGPENAAYFQDWRSLADTYRSGDTKGFSEAAETLQNHLAQKPGYKNIRKKFVLERAYYFFRPFLLALIFYGFSLAALTVSIYRTKIFSGRAASGFFGAGIAAHAGGIILRSLVLGRPPVGTLYESVLFVALICALGALVLYWRGRDKIVIGGGALTAFGLLVLSPYLLQKGESMEMLVAVLNTNFWLATHVLCITAGYGLCLTTSVLSHGYLALRAYSSGGLRHRLMLQQNIYRFSLAALFFVAFGTVLGGIWADQSWGRFWGWDPKENGALLIALWLIWLQHGRLSGHLGPLGFAACTAFLSVIVALAWFGVNLLSTGLHSYGFISGIAWGLGVFCALESAVIGWLWFRAAGKKGA